MFGLVQPGSDERFVPRGAEITHGDLADAECVKALVAQSMPDEVYNLGGITDLKTAFATPEATMKINYESVGVLLAESMGVNPNARFLQASSSEVFLPSPTPLNEESLRDWETKNPYAKAKMMADRDFILSARENNNSFACSAILFNHESPRRFGSSALRKITHTLVAITRGEETCLRIGNVTLRRDWGFAGDYVSAFWSMLQTKIPEDLVIATGETHSVQDAITATAKVLGMTLFWHGEGDNTCAFDTAGNKVVEVALDFYKPAERYPKVGNIGKAKQVIGWEPQTNFSSIITTMVNSALSS